MTKKILFFDAVAPYEYNFDILEKKGLGASESYLLSVANDLKKNFDVDISSAKVRYNYTQNDNLFINDISNILVYGKIKISTLNASISQTLRQFNIYLNNIMAGSYTISSDDRLKHNERDVSNALLTINKINPKKVHK